MKDIDLLEQILRTMGFQETGRCLTDVDPLPEYPICYNRYFTSIVIGPGTGETGIRCRFVFDDNGKFMLHTCWNVSQPKPLGRSYTSWFRPDPTQPNPTVNHDN